MCYGLLGRLRDAPHPSARGMCNTLGCRLLLVCLTIVGRHYWSGSERQPGISLRPPADVALGAMPLIFKDTGAYV